MMPPTVDESLAMRQAKDLSLSSKFLRLFATSAMIGFLAVTGSSIQLELSSGRYLGLISDLTQGAGALLDMHQTLDDLKLYARTVEQSRRNAETRNHGQGAPDPASLARSFDRLKQAMARVDARTFEKALSGPMPPLAACATLSDSQVSAHCEGDLRAWTRRESEIQAAFFAQIRARAEDLRGRARVFNAARYVILLAILGTVYGLGFAFVKRTIGRPLQSMVEAIRRLTSGDLENEIPAADRADEIGEFNRALRALQSSYVCLKHADEEKARQAAAQQQVVSRLAGALEGLAGGHLSTRVEEPLEPPYEKLRHDFNKTAERLEMAVQAIFLSAASLNAAVVEVNAVSCDLNQRVELQTADFDRAAPLLRSLMNTAEGTCKDARNAGQNASSATQLMGKAMVVVGATISAMDKIVGSSKKIAEIATFINVVAQEANMLALNTAVEAARAGEAGRGFAIVADEMRVLSGRTATAASSIRALAAEAATLTDEGASSAAATRETFFHMVEGISRINDLVQGIARVGVEQTTSLREVWQLIENIDNSIHANAGIAKAAHFAARSMVLRTDELSRLINHFRVDAPDALEIPRLGQKTSAV